MDLPTQTLEVVITRHANRTLTAQIQQDGRFGDNLLPGHITNLERAVSICREKVGAVMGMLGISKEIVWVLPEGEEVGRERLV